MKWTDARIEQVLAGRKGIHRKYIPALETDVGIRILPDGEIDAAKIDAQRYAKANGADVELDPEYLDREFERQIVWRSTYDAETISNAKPEPFFPSDKDVRSADAIVLRALCNAYLEIQDELAPATSLNEEEAQELVDALGKGHASEVLLTACSRDTLHRLLRSMALRVRETLRTTSSSTS